MTDSFPEFKPSVPETGPTEGDSYFAGRTKWTWRQPDLGDDGGYWEGENLTDQPALAEVFAQILERLTAIETALGIDPQNAGLE